jgi:hypothetical protein
LHADLGRAVDGQDEGIMDPGSTRSWPTRHCQVNVDHGQVGNCLWRRSRQAAATAFHVTNARERRSR